MSGYGTHITSRIDTGIDESVCPTDAVMGHTSLAGLIPGLMKVCVPLMLARATVKL